MFSLKAFIGTGAQRILPSISCVSSRCASTSSSERVGFIGLGNMGAGMAKNLLQKGHKVVVFDLNKTAVESLVDSGADFVDDSQDLPDQEGVTTIITMLPNSSHVQDVYGKILPRLRKGSLLIDSSTIDPLTSRELAVQVKEHGSMAVDAPVSGGVPAANAGTLTFMVGGEEEAEARARVYLECMGKNVVHCGSNGTGQVVKICNNMSLAIQMIGIGESMNLGMQLGMDPKKMAAIFNTATSRCWSGDSYNPVPGVMEGVPSSREYEGGFGSSLMLKDLGLAVDAAEKAGVTTPLGSMSREIYSFLQEHGLGGKDFSVAYEWIKNQNHREPVVSVTKTGAEFKSENYEA